MLKTFDTYVAGGVVHRHITKHVGFNHTRVNFGCLTWLCAVSTLVFAVGTIAIHVVGAASPLCRQPAHWFPYDAQLLFHVYCVCVCVCALPRWVACQRNPHVAHHACHVYGHEYCAHACYIWGHGHVTMPKMSISPPTPTPVNHHM